MTAQMDLPSIWDPEVDFGTPAIRAAVDTVSVTIDGRSVDVPAGTSVLRAATVAGVSIPKLCAMGGLTPMPVQSAIKHFPEDFQQREAALT
jgi:hypothetical protein